MEWIRTSSASPRHRVLARNPVRVCVVEIPQLPSREPKREPCQGDNPAKFGKIVVLSFDAQPANSKTVASVTRQFSPVQGLQGRYAVSGIWMSTLIPAQGRTADCHPVRHTSAEDRRTCRRNPRCGTTANRSSGFQPVQPDLGGGKIPSFVSGVAWTNQAKTPEGIYVLDAGHGEGQYDSGSAARS